MSGVTFHYNRSTGQIWSSGFIYSVVRFWSNLPTSVFISTFFWDWHNFVRIFLLWHSCDSPPCFSTDLGKWECLSLDWWELWRERVNRLDGPSSGVPHPSLPLVSQLFSLFRLSCVCEMNMWSVSAVRKEDFIVAILQSVINQFYRIVVLKLWSGAFWAIPRHLCRSNVIYRTSNN